MGSQVTSKQQSSAVSTASAFSSAASGISYTVDQATNAGESWYPSSDRIYATDRQYDRAYTMDRIYAADKPGPEAKAYATDRVYTDRPWAQYATDRTHYGTDKGQVANENVYNGRSSLDFHQPKQSLSQHGPVQQQHQASKAAALLPASAALSASQLPIFGRVVNR